VVIFYSVIGEENHMKLFFRFILFLFISTLLLNNCNTPTDSKSGSQTLTVANVWFTNSEDYDNDGYNSYARLNIDVNISSGSENIILEVGIRVHDPADTALFYLYATSPVIPIEGNSQDDARSLGIADLPQGAFDFLILVYRSSDTEIPVAEANPETHSALKNVPFEIESTDAGLEIFDVFHLDFVDHDGDGYASELYMGVDVDVSVGFSSVAFLAIFSKESSESDYQLLSVTDTFTVVGESSDDAVGFQLTNFPKNSYDFLIQAYYFDGIDVEDQMDKNDDLQLADIWLEPANEDFIIESLQHHDDSFEDAIWYDSGDFTSSTMFVAGFNKPANTVSCYITMISLHMSSDPVNNMAPIKLRALGTSSTLFSPVTKYFCYPGWTNYAVNIDISNEDRFFAGYLQTLADIPKLSLDRTFPHSGSSYWYDGSEWIPEESWDYGISVQIEYIPDDGIVTKQSKTITKWLTPTASSLPSGVNQVANTVN
jgi:hypothetical protein